MSAFRQTLKVKESFMFFGLGKPPPPNTIDTVPVPGSVGCMGLVGCPGVRIDAPPTGSKRMLDADINEIVQWGANGVLCLVEPHELVLNKVEALPASIQKSGMWWKHLPIVDMDIPNQEFENIWAVEGERIRHALRIGERVAIHCYAGLGRTGMIAARILVEFGVEPEQAIRRIRRDNRRRIQTRSQANFVRSCYSLVGTEDK
jgi:protein-tyrosine phosphatase